MAYDSFWQAYQAQHPDSPYTPAAQTWTPQNLQDLANPYSALNPTWTPPAAQNAALPHPVTPTTFSPFSDPNYLLGAAGLQQQHQLAQGAYDYGVGVGGAAGAGGMNFGYDYDPATGQVKQEASTVSGYNPYNQAAQLQRSYDNAKRGTTNNYAASGQLYSGALQNAQADNTYNYNRSSDTLQRGAADYYHGLQNSLDAVSAPSTKAILDALTNFLQTQGG